MRAQAKSRVEVDTATYLAHAVAAAREHGFVPTASIDGEPTWRAALERFERAADLQPADLHRAREILGWAASLKLRDSGGYRARLAACLASDRLAAGDLPLAASAVRAFNLHLYYEIRGRRTRKGQPVLRAQRHRPMAFGEFI